MKSFLLSMLLVFGFVGVATADRIVIREPRDHAPVARPHGPSHEGYHARPVPVPVYPHYRPYYGHGFSFSFGIPVVPYYVNPAPRLTRVYDALTGYYYYYDYLTGVYYGPYVR